MNKLEQALCGCHSELTVFQLRELQKQEMERLAKELEEQQTETTEKDTNNGEE